jgi:hypothetical protein
MTPRPETTLEGRVFMLTIGLILLGVLVLKFSLDVGGLERRVTAVEVAISK